LNPNFLVEGFNFSEYSKFIMKIETLQKSRKENELIGPLEVVFGIYSNKGKEKCIIQSEKLFSRARSSIRIVSGILNHDFYDDDRIIGALEKAVDRKVSVEIISGPEIDEKSKRILDLNKQGKIKILKLQNTPELHYSIIDEKHARLENFHSTYDEESLATIEWWTIGTAVKLMGKYKKLRQQAELLQPGEAA